MKSLCQQSQHITLEKNEQFPLKRYMSNNSFKISPLSFQLDHKDDSPVKFIITTCMDPWATSTEFLDDLAAIMRNSILCAIGSVRPRPYVSNMQVVYYRVFCCVFVPVICQDADLP